MGDAAGHVSSHHFVIDLIRRRVVIVAVIVAALDFTIAFVVRGIICHVIFAVEVRQRFHWKKDAQHCVFKPAAPVARPLPRGLSA